MSLRILPLLALFATGCSSDSTDSTDSTDSGSATDSGDVGSDTGDAGVDCADDVCVLSGTIVEDMTLTSDVAWLLRGGVFVGDDTNETVLTIEPGTVIYGETSTDGMLVVRRGSKLMAEGTAEAPIVMTSSKAPGSRARGDWGGLILNGRAPINACADSEGAICEAYGEGATGWYGGNDATDSSGVLKYVRVEFAGTLVSPENELNGIAFQGVGNGTTVDYIQVHMNADDGVEFYGGTVNAKHVLVTAVGDDSLDWTDGWVGMAQYVVLHQFDDNGDNGIEADNNGEANDATPRSAPHLANLTIVGSPDSEKSDIGMLLREGTAAKISHAVVAGFNDACFDIDNSATWAQVDNGGLAVTNSWLDCAKNFKEDGDFEDDGLSTETTFMGWAGNGTGAAGLDGAFNLSAPNYVSTEDLSIDAAAPFADSFFDNVDYIGAIGSEDWTAGWTTHVVN